ncbi:methyltransferase domain-containing protein [Marinilabiliaceae bacterium JC017]|nr:methyltransferase domain-containing protein [Marinilabiliaceae bacterium JC017]
MYIIKKLYQTIVPEKIRMSLWKKYYKYTSFLFGPGDKYHCNICNKSFRRFRSHGIIKRNNAKCPYCLSLERTRLLWFYLDKEVNITDKSWKILHVAPEEGLKNRLKKINSSHYFDIDINPTCAYIKMDLTDLRFQKNFFNLIICSHVLGHITNEGKALSEIFRVLDKSGIALIMTVLSERESTFENINIISRKERIQNFGEPDLVRLHGKDFPERLKLAGFKVEEIDYRINLGRDNCEIFSLGDGKRERIFKCSKR